MTDNLQRIAEADQAKIAWDRFVAPALATMRADYMSKLTDEAIKPMEGRALAAVQSLSLALRVTREVEGQMRALILDGAQAQQDLDRAGKVARMGPEERRFASY
jgi:hypothetical protein